MTTLVMHRTPKTPTASRLASTVDSRMTGVAILGPPNSLEFATILLRGLPKKE
jgi:hypothetical protein